MSAIGITGGIATGKSTVSAGLYKSLSVQLTVEWFNADFEARRLTDSDLGVQEEIRSVFGAQLFDSERRLRRERLRELVFRDPSARKILEGILHPRIRSAWLERANIGTLLLAEIPLLFETKAEEHLDLVVVTACSRSTQINRLVEARGLAPDLAESMIAAQMPLEEKIKRGDRLVWTDCPTKITTAQIDRLSAELLERYGESTN
ncbi:MAG TPA: dephospho-CoA kinase [Chthoniobacterales bacterium]|nr:dephospho-CoA kinase [Chthoniobacterales bacterium]